MLSAQIPAAFTKYLRETGAEMDIDQFVDIFGARAGLQHPDSARRRAPVRHTYDRRSRPQVMSD